ncbi:MAG TPA: SDR family NAD(P)-dependent oxidoreductase [Solirubrobacteraceae bacterium]
MFRSTTSALERVPHDVRRRAWRLLEDVTRRVPRAALTAPIGGRLPLLRPEVSRERLGRAIGTKRVLITGATSGIGLETAYAIARAQGQVILVARGEDRLIEVASQIRALGGWADLVSANLSDAGEADSVVEAVLDRHGGVDVLINNAGHSIRRPLARSYDRDHDFERTMALNYFGALRLILGFLPGMRDRGDGHIVNISTLGVEIGPEPRFSAYLASKAALDAFTASAAPETSHDGVSWTTVYMPLVSTPMIAPTSAYQRVPTLTPPEASELVLEALVYRSRYVSTPIGRIGAVLYRISPATIESLFNLGFRLVPDESEADHAERERERARSDGRQRQSVG